MNDIPAAAPFNRRRKLRANMILRRAARRLELRSFGLVPEHFSHMEGLRAAVAVALPLALAVTSGRPGLGWAVFAAFWTCLCDAPGPDKLRRHLLAIFVGGGALIAVAGSWIASSAPYAGMIVGPVFVFLAVLCSSRIPYGGLLGTLLAVVAVVAVGFPHPLEQAAIQAVAFLGGSIWAYLLINRLWHIDAMVPLARATDAVIVRLLDMAESLVVLGDGRHRDDQWHREHAEHRRTVRLAIERLRSLLDRYSGDAASTEPFERARDAAETLFGALIALDQAFIDRIGPSDERMLAARACRTALLAWSLRSAAREPRVDALEWAAVRLRRLEARLHEPVFAGCVLAFESALRGLVTPAARCQVRPEAGRSLRKGGITRAVLQQALRQSLGLIAVYYAAIQFHLGYPYWAAMAVVVVLQGGARVTWARCLERIAGSLLGGVIAWGLLLVDSVLPVLSGLAIILAGVAIAMRSVNYTVFVVFLTMLFVIVTEMLQPGAGIASARMLDNVIGSIAALLAVFVLWPDFGASLKQRIEEGVEANHRYFEAVRMQKPIAEIENARRGAGLASVEAEVALYDVGGMLRRLSLSESNGSALQDLRTIAGEAAIAWHRRLGAVRAEGGNREASIPSSPIALQQSSDLTE